MSKFIYDIDLNQNQLQNAVIQSLSTAPSNPKEGQIYYDTTDKNIYRFDGTSWVTYQSELETTATSTLSIDSTPTNNSSNLVTSGGVYTALQNVDSLPDQTGQSGKYLTTNGTSASWAAVQSGDSLPDQTGQSGKFLTTDGTDASWSDTPMIKGTDYVTAGQLSGTTLGTKATAEGYNTTASNQYAHAEGNGTTASGFASHAEGNGTIASGARSHAEGSGSIASAYTSHAEGSSTKAIKDSSHAEGSHTRASGYYSHAEGSNSYTYEIYLTGEANATTYTVNSSSIETEYFQFLNQSDFATFSDGQKVTSVTYNGDTLLTITVDSTLSDSAISNELYDLFLTNAAGYSSHSEGGNSHAVGQNSHAEGTTTLAGGDSSHAEGFSAVANGIYSHAEGVQTIAQRRSQHVFGEYNVLDTTGSTTTKGKYVEIVGKGTSTSERSNARTLDWSGNEVLAGKLTVGTGPTNNMDVATKQYVDGAIPSVPTGSSTSPKMDGTATVGTETTWSHGDHVHPTDTSRQAKITASGILKGNGSGTISAAVAGTDYVASESDPTVPSWAKASSKPSYTATEVGAQPTITASGILKGNGSGTISAAVAGTDYQAPITNPITGTGQNKYLAKFNGTNSITSGPELIAAGDGTYLTHSGLWADPLPSRTGNSGKFLTTNGTSVSWANVSGVEYFTISDDIEWTLYPASTFVSCYNSGKMPIVIYNGVHCYPRNINEYFCLFNGIYSSANSGFAGYELSAFEDADENIINPWYVGGGSSVSYTPTLSSGTKVGTITIDGTDNDIYAPTNTDSDVTQTKGNYSSYTYWRPVTVGSSTNSSVTGAFSTTTDNEYAFDNLRYQPSTGTLRTRIYNVAPNAAATTASDNQMTSDSVNNIYFRVNNGTDTIMTLYSNGTDMQVRPGGQYDNQVDLGKSTVRWKDAYLSGTVNAADYNGDVTATATVASGDKIIIRDTSATKIAGGITLGSSTTQYLANDGSWQNIPSSGTQVSLVDWTV